MNVGPEGALRLRVSIHIRPIHQLELANSPLSRTSVKGKPTEDFSTLMGTIATNKPVSRTNTTTQQQNAQTSTSPSSSTSSTGASGTSSSGTTGTTSSGPSSAPAVVTSSDGTSLANLMAAASYAGVPYSDLGQQFNNGVYDPAWQQKMANALESRLQSVAGGGASSQVYDPNPSNDTVAVDPTNTKQFMSSADEIQGLLNNMWSAVHAGDVSGYHNALQQVDTWYQSNGQQNYYTGLSDSQVAAFNPANVNMGTSMPNANATVASAELSAIVGKSSAMSNLASVAQSALAGAIKT